MSDTGLHRRASELFLEVRELPAEQRDEAIDSAAAGDARLRAEVESLLSYDDDVLDPHHTPTVDSPGLASSSSAGLEHGGGLQPPSTIGPYRLVRRIGRGGSGHVFLAAQHEPIERRVAIKIVPQAAIDPELAARFEVERRALERTDHPNIARVLDAGRTPDGLPYLVMDFVEGVSITEYCDREEVHLEQRITMMLQVADAIQHAHQRGIIHRDLKPANVLVNEVDGRATPIVLDFGISKPMTGKFPVQSPPTGGMFLGTPSYMAPEQTGGQSVDTRADVYALGAILYELVSGRPPISSDDDPVEVLRAIRETVPPPPSRLRLNPEPICHGVSRAFLTDLDCIIAKALEKKAARRYAGVDGLAEDLRRLLRCEPIDARPPALSYRAARFAQRNRALVTSALAIALALILGVVGLSFGLVEANRQRRIAMTQRETAEAINEFLNEDLLAAASPEQMGGKDLTAVEMLDRASRRIDLRFPEQPLIAASLHQTLGEAYAAIGGFDAAAHHLDRAMALRTEAMGPDAPELLRAQIASASLLVRRERYGDALEILPTLEPRARQLLGRDDPDLYTVLNDLGVACLSVGRIDDAIDKLEEALSGNTRLHGREHREVHTTMSNLAIAHFEAGDAERCLQLLRDSLTIVESIPDESPMLLIGLNANIGVIYMDLDQNLDAEPFIRKAAALAEEFLDEDHPYRLSIEGSIAGLETDLGDPHAAMDRYQQVFEKQRRILGETAESTLNMRYGYFDSMRKAGRNAEAAAGFQALLDDVLGAHGEDFPLVINTRLSIARSLLDAGRPHEASAYAQAAVAQSQSAHGPDHPRTQSAMRLRDAIDQAAAADER